MKEASADEDEQRWGRGRIESDKARTQRVVVGDKGRGEAASMTMKRGRWSRCQRLGLPGQESSICLVGKEWRGD